MRPAVTLAGRGPMKNLALHYQILIALAVAVLLGMFFDERTQLLGVPLSRVLGFFGDLFLRALKMLVVPLIVASVITGVAGMGDQEGMKRLGLKTAGYYLTSSFVAILIGLGWVQVVQPGIANGKPARDLLGLGADTSAVMAQVSDRSSSDIVDVFLRMVPPNVLADAAAGEMLGVIVFALLFGFFTTKIGSEPRRVVVLFWQGVYEVMLKMTDFVLLFAPLGVLGLVGKVALSTGASAIMPLLSFVLTVLGGLLAHAFVFLPAMLRLFGVPPVQFLRTMLPALLMAFSTASSAGTLPLTMERVGDAGVSTRVASFTLPLGATVNMDGTALYECVAAVFIAQAYGISLSFGQLFVVVMTALLTSIGVAGIPAASLVAITLILSAVGLPLEGLGLILAVDRVLDMCRTTVNVFSDSCAAVLIAKSEGEPVLDGSPGRQVP